MGAFGDVGGWWDGTSKMKRVGTRGGGGEERSEMAVGRCREGGGRKGFEEPVEEEGVGWEGRKGVVQLEELWIGRISRGTEGGRKQRGNLRCVEKK